MKLMALADALLVRWCKITIASTQPLAYNATVNQKINRAAQALGRLGGKAGTGKAKARSSKQARAAVMARWSKARQAAQNKQA